eukprot:5406907-Pleurochrysis_carterae.AAC.1
MAAAFTSHGLSHTPPPASDDAQSRNSREMRCGAWLTRLTLAIGAVTGMQTVTGMSSCGPCHESASAWLPDNRTRKKRVGACKNQVVCVSACSA